MVFKQGLNNVETHKLQLFNAFQ